MTVDVDDPRQNEFVQLWLHAYNERHNATRPDPTDYDEIERTIEQVQETWRPSPEDDDAGRELLVHINAPIGRADAQRLDAAHAAGPAAYAATLDELVRATVPLHRGAVALAEEA